jgi:hypothetical protein
MCINHLLYTVHYLSDKICLKYGNSNDSGWCVFHFKIIFKNMFLYQVICRLYHHTSIIIHQYLE